MRLITWNCQGAFRRKHAFAAALRPDVLVVPECENPTGLQRPLGAPPVRAFEWFGRKRTKGLAVLSYGDYALEVHPRYDPRHQWIVPLSVSGPVSFVLIAVWSLPLGDYRSRYVRPVLEALETYKSLMTESEVVWAGDFNSNFVWDTPARRFKFRDLVALLGQNGLHSLYHKHRKCEHGEEPENTFYLFRHADKGYHIDYVFASDRFHRHGFEVSIGSHSEWGERSDHAPLICDFAVAPKRKVRRSVPSRSPRSSGHLRSR
jgi:endonuclease/exonuclease/phosphatase family metal-dependent hydrolase